MKKFALAISVLAIIVLSACGKSNAEPKKSKTSISINDGELVLSTDKNGDAKVNIEATKGSEVKGHYKINGKVIKFNSKKSTFTKIVALPANVSSTTIFVTATKDGSKSSEDSVEIENNSDARNQAKRKKAAAESSAAAASSSEAEAEAESESIKEKKIEAKESQEEASYESKKENNTVKVGNLSYKKVDLVNFTDDPEKYDGQNIQTEGQVIMIQKDPDDSTMYFVVIAPTDSSTSSGYADGHGTVAQIDIDTVKENNIQEGNDLTVNGGALVNAVTLNNQTVNSSIIVDSVS